MLWITYDTQLRYSHILKDEQWVEDKSCLEVHDHNATLKFEIQTILVEPIDFKKIKQVINDIITPYAGENISERFGIYSTEDFACKLVAQVEIALANVGSRRIVNLHIQETMKYGVTVRC